MNMRTALLSYIGCIAVLGCTAAQGKLDATILTGACEAGAIILAVPAAEPICADISVIEQIVANWNAPEAAGVAHAKRPMTQADLYYMVKASGRYKRVK